MFNWIRTKLDSLKSHYSRAAAPGETKEATDPRVIARLVVTYDVMEGTSAEELLVHAKSHTEFKPSTDPLVKNATNSAAEILIDQPSVGMFYSSLINNMLYVPTELRDKPN